MRVAGDTPASTEAVPICDVLLFVTTETEEEALLDVARKLELACERRSDPELDDYFDLGTVGRKRVVAVRTRIGTIEHRAATSQAIRFQAKTNATFFVATGMAWGLSSEQQSLGEVLVSRSLFPYDDREMVDSPTGPVPNYDKTKRRLSSQTLFSLVKAESQREDLPFKVTIGMLLSGGTRVSSRNFRNALAAGIPESSDTIIGGDMEGVGLLAVAPADDPRWLVVKGISDFGEGSAEKTDKTMRAAACRNAVWLVLSAFLHERK